eukprot:6205562-Pleurochrysis_carterae.AAC.4
MMARRWRGKSSKGSKGCATGDGDKVKRNVQRSHGRLNGELLALDTQVVPTTGVSLRVKGVATSVPPACGKSFTDCLQARSAVH